MRIIRTSPSRNERHARQARSAGKAPAGAMAIAGAPTGVEGADATASSSEELVASPSASAGLPTEADALLQRLVADAGNAGDNPNYTPEMLAKRAELLEHPAVRGALDDLWETANANDDAIICTARSS